MSIVERAIARLRSGAQGQPPAEAPAAPAPPQSRKSSSRQRQAAEAAPAPAAERSVKLTPRGPMANPNHAQDAAAAVPWRLKGAPGFLNQLRVIKRNLLDALETATAGRSQDGRVLMVTSAVPGEGKTFTSIAVARSLAADTGRTVLLIDADMPRRAASGFFGLQDTPGLAEVLSGRISLDDAVSPTEVPGLMVLPAGQANVEGAELVAGTRFDALVAQLRDMGPSFIAVIDTAPVLAAGETTYAAGRVDYILTVIRADSTARGAVEEAVRKFGDTVPRGVVLNGLQTTFIEDYYGYSESYAYGKEA